MSRSEIELAAGLLIETKIFQAANLPALSESLQGRALISNYIREEKIDPNFPSEPALGLILTGRAGVHKMKAKISELGVGDLFGAVNIFTSLPGDATLITALVPTKVLYIPQSLMREFMADNLAIAEGYIAYLSQRVYFLTTKIGALTAGDSQAKLACALLELSYETKGGKQYVKIENFSALARDLDMGRASLYRALDKLEAQAIIKRKGKLVEINDSKALKAFLEN